MFALVDCNNFYASCERLFQPQLKDRPIVVLSNNDGCIVARSNEAKALGIPMGAPAFKMKALLHQHQVAVFSSNYALYGDMSKRVMQTLAQLIPEIEIYSIDESFLDLRAYQSHLSLQELGESIRATVQKHTGITVSVGIAPSKTLAKLANHLAKKQVHYEGVMVMNDPITIEKLLGDFPVEKIWGIGRKYAKKLQQQGVYTALQLRDYNDAWVRKNLTIQGLKMVYELRGQACFPMEFIPPTKKSICCSRSFGKEVTTFAELKESVSTYAHRCGEKLRRQNSCTRLLTVFIHTNAFKPNRPQYRNSKMLQLPIVTNDSRFLVQYGIKALEMIYRKGYHYKKAGVYLTDIVPANQVQTSLFDQIDQQKSQALMRAMDHLNGRMGNETLRIASQGFKRQWKLRQEQLSPCYTTRWEEILVV